MSNFNEKLIERISKVQEQVNKLETLDLNNIVDVKKAKETLRVIKDDFEQLIKENPVYANVVNMVTKFMDYDIMAELTRWSEYLDNKIEEFKRKDNFKKANVEKEVIDKSETNKKEPANVWDDIEGEDELNDDVQEDDEHLRLEDYPLTGQELIDDYIDECTIETSNLDSAKLKTYTNLIAEFLNTHYVFLDRYEDDKQIEYFANVLFEFVVYTMNR